MIGDKTHLAPQKKVLAQKSEANHSVCWFPSGHCMGFFIPPADDSTDEKQTSDYMQAKLIPLQIWHLFHTHTSKHGCTEHFH